MGGDTRRKSHLIFTIFIRVDVADVGDIFHPSRWPQISGRRRCLCFAFGAALCCSYLSRLLFPATRSFPPLSPSLRLRPPPSLEKMEGGEREDDGPPAAAPSSTTAGRQGMDGKETAAGIRQGDPVTEQQQQRQVIRWDRFLPRRSLRVMLVEHDDSTRHIVTALLRKCSYHVTAVADGLKAWEIMEEKQYRFDLVLTEVEMPSLSGIGLLSKIMGCGLSKSIPVIMTSSHDSVNVVFKCMLKGAVDFLVKPVRRNELRNLWQHVWRKHCSTSNGPENININQTKSEDMSENNAASNHLSANVGGGAKNKERCDEGSDTQSSGSNPETEIESVPRQVEPNLTDNRSPSMLMETKSEKPRNVKVMIENASRKCDSRVEENKSVTIGVEVNFSVQENALTEKSPEKNCFYDRTSTREETMINREDIGHNLESRRSFAQKAQPNKSSKQAIDFIGAVADRECSYAILEKNGHREENQCETTKSFKITDATTSDELPSWELSLRGPHLNDCSEQGYQEMHALKHSAASAFSRYGTSIRFSCKKSGSSAAALSATTKEHEDKLRSDLSNCGANQEGVPLPPWNLTSSQGGEAEAIICRQVTSAINNKDADPFAARPSREVVGGSHPSNDDNNNHNMVLSLHQQGLVSHPFPIRGLPFQSLRTGYGSILQPLFYPEHPFHGSAGPEKANDSGPVQFNHRGNHVAYDLPSTMLQQCIANSHSCHLEKGREYCIIEEDLRDHRVYMCSDMEQSHRSGVCNQNILNGSGSNGSGEITDAANNAGIAAESGNESGYQNRDRKELDRDRSLREAALIKFRLKRKERCFEKKVRYHTRKKLAEQRPRVKGQFVRQSAVESNAVTTEEDD